MTSIDNAECLILNANYRPLCYLPLSVIPWQRAIKLSFMERVTIIENYDIEIHSPSVTMKIPAIAVTKDYMKYQKVVRFSRKNLFLRDLYECQYCSETFQPADLTMDHVLPISRGGKTEWDNVVTACSMCNLKKGSKIMQPKRLPFKPAYWHLVNNRSSLANFVIKHPSWNQYIEI